MHRRTVIAALAAAPLALAARPAAASSPQELIDRARLALQAVRTDTSFQPNMDQLLRRARAVLIVPNMFRGGFIIGGEGGTGVMLARDADGGWSPPAFYDTASGSIGLQIGAQTAEVVFLIMNDKALRKFLDNQFKIGGDLSIAVGPIGGGADAALPGTFNADIYSYSKSEGLYAGGTLEGTLIQIKETWNRGYYGPGATARDILFGGRFEATGAAALRQALDLR